MTQRVVAVVDYGSGNLRSVSQAVKHAAQGQDVEVRVTQSAKDILEADRVVLPGQGHMGDCMQSLDQSGLLPAVLHAAQHKPLFGVCVGMQMLLDRSDEGPTDGLGLIPGTVQRFELTGRLQADGSRFKVPQMGWNRVFQAGGSQVMTGAFAAEGQPLHPLWQGIADGSYFYFVHSYFVQPVNPQHAAGVCDYGGWFAAAVARDNLFATQFHPEKSADQGLRLYRNFLHWHPGSGEH